MEELWLGYYTSDLSPYLHPQDHFHDRWDMMLCPSTIRVSVGEDVFGMYLGKPLFCMIKQLIICLGLISSRYPGTPIEYRLLGTYILAITV